MIASSSELINPSPRGSDVIRLKELDICAGRLDNITSFVDQDIAVAAIEDLAVEIPIDFVDTMYPMVGKRIFLAKIDNCYRFGVCSR